MSILSYVRTKRVKGQQLLHARQHDSWPYLRQAASNTALPVVEPELKLAGVL